MSNMLRSLARTRAKANMKHLGFRQIYKHQRGLSSYFADNWREHTNNVTFVDLTNKKNVRIKKEVVNKGE